MDEFAKHSTPGRRLMLDCSAWGRTKGENWKKKKAEPAEGDSGDSGELSACSN